MAATKARTPNAPTKRKAPRPGQAGPSSSRPLVAVGALAVIAIAIAGFALTRNGGSGTSGSPASGLPNTSDYHSLLVSPDAPSELLLGTHQGIFRSLDGGRHWASYTLGGNDAMNLVQPGGGQTVWMTGHDVFARSTDGGQNWQTLQPSSLPSLDLHGFAVDPKTPSTLYAAIAGIGLFRSTNTGSTFIQISKDVGGMVMALAVSPGGEILAGDMQRGLLVSSNGGKTWQRTLKAQLAGLAIDPKNSTTILATGPGILRSTDGGKNWAQVMQIDAGAGPVAWSPLDSKVAFVVGFDRTLYRSADSGASWTAVG